MRNKSKLSQAAGFIPWIPTIAGVIALLVVMVIATIRLTPWSSRQAPLLPTPLTAAPFPITNQESSPPPAFAIATSTEQSETPTRTNGEATVGGHATVSTPATPAIQPIVGHYRVVNSFGSSFVGEVLIVNDSGEARDWTVLLTFPANVGRLRTSWLEALPQPKFTQSGQIYTWRSTTPLAAHSSGALRFQFDRSGTRENPSRCLANDSPCQ